MSNRSRIRPALRAWAGTFLLFIVFVLPASGAAQGERDPRFGLAYAYQAPEAAADLGAAWETVPFRWDQLQPSGPGDWNVAPALVDGISAAVSAGREVVGVLVGTPAWAAEGEPGRGVPRGLYLPESDTGNVWAAFVRQAVNYGAARGINRWVIWEGSIPPGAVGDVWTGNTQDTYQLVKVASTVAREANPNALIHLGDVGGSDPTWFAQFLDVVIDDSSAPANDYYFDVVMLSSFYSPEQLYARLQERFVAMEQKGIPLKEVWVGRMNARPAIDPVVYPDGAAFSQHPNIALEQQAAYIVQAYALGFAANRGARIAVYRLVDDLAEDGGEAFGLLRADGSRRPAYDAYRLVVRELGGFVYARRLDAETHPDLEYVRFTFPTKVTHVVWARGQQAATLVIPARSAQARLLDIYGNEWTVEPEGGSYRVAAPAAACDDPQMGCLIGGLPWLLVEEGLADPLNETAPPVTVEPGGEPPAPEAAPATPSPQSVVPAPVTGTPAPAEGAATRPAPTAEPVLTGAAAADTSSGASADGGPPGQSLPRPMASRLLPFALIGAGVVVILGGSIYYLAGRRSARGQAPDE